MDELFNGLQPYKKDISGEQLRKQVDIIFNNIYYDHIGYLVNEAFFWAAIDKAHILFVNFFQFASNSFYKTHDVELTLKEAIKKEITLKHKNITKIF